MSQYLSEKNRTAPAGKFRITIFQETERVERDVESLDYAKSYVNEFKHLWAFRVYDDKGEVLYEEGP